MNTNDIIVLGVYDCVGGSVLLYEFNLKQQNRKVKSEGLFFLVLRNSKSETEHSKKEEVPDRR